MDEFFVRVATPADVDRVWPLFDEVENERLFLTDTDALELVELRRAQLVQTLLESRVLVAYSGIRAVGYLLPGDDPYISPSWRGLGVEDALRGFQP
jgi:hypothetical protein